MIDTATGERTGYRSGERFAMCSTFKMLLTAAILRRADAGAEDLSRSLAIPAPPLLPNSPVTSQHIRGEMTVAALCSAAMTRSDNTAANLLLANLGGPGAVTQLARSLGDAVTRLDRNEPSLNEAVPGDPRDTTSPLAMAQNLRALALGHVLSPRSRTQLFDWMVANETGLDCLRAGIPPGWRVGDKTGSGERNTRNDVAIAWPRLGGPPVIVAAYLTECPGSDARRNAVLAEIGRFVAAAVH